MNDAKSAKRLTVGLQWTEEGVSLTSVKRLVAVMTEELGQDFIVRSLPSYFSLLRAEQQQQEWNTLFAEADVVLGGSEVVAARQAANADTPVIYLALGDFPRGANGFREIFQLLRAKDTILFSSRPDREVYERLVSECKATTALLPFFVDDGFGTISRDERQALRKRFGLSSQDVLFAYVGRLTAEKNFHSVMRVLAAVAQKHSNVYLTAVGPLGNDQFFDFRSGPVDVATLYQHLASRHPVLWQRGTLNPAEVRPSLLSTIYNVADVFISLTLHHDENFGFAQVEAMASGLPVIGTDWGGLRDTIVHGETGYHVDTYLTEWGVRPDLWQAVRYAERLVESDALRARLGKAGRDEARRKYTRKGFAAGLRDIIFSGHARQHGVPRTNRLSHFGERYAAAFPSARPHYDRGNYSLYAGLIGPYSTSAPPPFSDDADVLCLAFPGVEVSGRTVVIRDPLWPSSEELAELEIALLVWLDERDRSGHLFATTKEARACFERSHRPEAVDGAIDGLVRRGLLIRSASKHEFESAAASVAQSLNAPSTD